ncbi:MAG TPA: hypothetical protein VE734_09790 [Terriglobales bacterium]|jgi:hypothetical protein|nr:hypothetical protein [Terriglobales bacterium]
MRLVRVAWFFIALFFITWGWILWKAPKGQAQDHSQAPIDLAEVVKKQFGPCFEVATERSTATANYLHPQPGPPWTSFLEADLDGDGVQDAIIVARCKTPLTDEVTHSYKVVDPYYTNYGYGDPKITTRFNAADPNRQHLVLVIHGAGTEAWRAAAPKAKFVIINLPFDSLSLTQVTHRKRPLPALSLLEEEQQLTSTVYWDGKKYKWADTGGMQ